MTAPAEIPAGNRVERVSELRADPEAVWAAATDFDGMSDEMRPLARMTMPRSLRGLDLDELPIGEPVGRSWLLLFGLLPFEYDRLKIDEIEPPRRFLERSTMASFSVWEHERTIEPLPAGGCRVRDRVGFRLRAPLARIPGMARLSRAIVSAFFSHRHRRLRRRDTVAA
jgi:ligand-binding SRPBCC domain-containing protein